MIAHAKLEFDFGGGSLAGVGALFAQSGVVPLPAITGPANVLLEAIGGVPYLLTAVKSGSRSEMIESTWKMSPGMNCSMR